MRATSVLALSCLGACAVTIHNPPRGTTDSPHDAHDGTIVQWQAGGPYWRYAMAYTECTMNSGDRAWLYRLINWVISTFSPYVADCAGFACAPIMFGGFEDCGFLPASKGQTVRVWRSVDLASWELVGDALDSSAPLLQDAILFRPAVIFNPTTSKYVLWVNRIPHGRTVWEGYTRGGFVVAEAAEPSGPFALVGSPRHIEYGGGGDFSLLADGERAWIAYGSWDNGYKTHGIHSLFPAELNAGHRIAIQPLDATFTDADGSVAAVTVTEADQEAPTLFKHAGYYYLLHGDVCCFCPQGSDLKVKAASHPMSTNWTHVGNINPYRRAGQQLSAQSNGVVEVALADGSTSLVWTGDQWGGSRSGRKGDDTQVWAPLEFESRPVRLAAEAEAEEVPVPLSLRWRDEFELELEGCSSDV